MRADLVVVSTPVLYGDLRIHAITKPLHRQTLIAKLSVKGLVGPVLRWFARVDQCRLDLLRSKPSQDRTGEKLRPIVGPQVLRCSMNTDELGEDLPNPCTADAACHIDGQCHPRELVDHRGALQLLPIGAGVEHEIICPQLARALWRQRARARTRNTAPRPLAPHHRRWARSARIEYPRRSRNTWIRR